MGLLGYSSARRSRSALSLHVDGRSYANAAAKFWISLMDELQDAPVSASRLVLSAPGAESLGTHLLHPEHAAIDPGLLSHGLDMASRMRETLAELEAMGPPAAVRACVYDGEKALLDAALPEECLDAETFPYLVVWLLQWARVPLERWNDPRVEGEVVAVSGKDRCRYTLPFGVAHLPLSEGLFSREVTVRRSPWGWREDLEPDEQETPGRGGRG